MIGHVEMESYPTQMTIQYGNGDEGSFYTMGKPVSRARGKESRKTATSYAYQRSATSTPTRRCLTLVVSV